MLAPRHCCPAIASRTLPTPNPPAARSFRAIAGENPALPRSARESGWCARPTWLPPSQPLFRRRSRCRPICFRDASGSAPGQAFSETPPPLTVPSSFVAVSAVNAQSIAVSNAKDDTLGRRRAADFVLGAPPGDEDLDGNDPARMLVRPGMVRSGDACGSQRQGCKSALSRRDSPGRAGAP